MSTGAIYARVSTSRQEDGTSLETQVEECKILAAESGCPVNESHIWQESASGAHTNRRGFQELLQQIDIGILTDVFIHAPDRAARDPLDLLNFCRRCSTAGVELHFVVGPQGNDEYTELIRFVSGFAGRHKRRMIAERTMRGKREIARSGRYPQGTGRGIYGYDYDPLTKTRTINEAEASVVRRIFQMTAAGRSIWSIAAELNDEQIPTKHGGKWFSLSVGRVLKKTQYYGVDYYGQGRHTTDEHGNRKSVERPKEEWIEIRGYSPPIISESLFHKARKQLSRPTAVRAVKKPYLLTGFTLCGACGSQMSGATRMANRRRYRCQATVKTAISAATCHASYINADELEATVWAEVVRALKDPSVLVSDLQRLLSKGDGNIAEEIANLRREIRELRRQETNFVALAKNPAFDPEIVAAQNAPILALRREKEQALGTLEALQKRHDEVAEMEKQLLEYCQTIGENIDSIVDFDRKRETFAAFGVEVSATKRAVKIIAKVDPQITTTARTSA